MPTMKLTPEIISAAILGYETEKAGIDKKIAELRGMMPGGGADAALTPKALTPKLRTISAAGRKAIAEAQRKRWAAKKAAEPAPAEAAKPKRKLSAAGRKRIIEATKKRWAAVKAAKAQQEKAAARK
jgi:hypothetical protein